MTVYDRWHKTHPKPDEEKCKEHKLVPSAEHEIGDRWQVRYRDEFGNQKKKNFKKKVGKNPEEHADAYDAKVTTQLSQGTWIDPAKEKTLLSVIIPEWVSLQRGDARSVDNRIAKVRNSIGPFLGDNTLKELTSNSRLIQSWIDYLENEKKYAPNTVIGYKNVLGTILNFAVKERYIGYNPLKSRDFVEIRPNDKKKVIPYTQEEVRRLREELPKQLLPILELGLRLGLRIGETFALSRSDVMDHGVISIGRQIKRVNKQQVFALPKRRKIRIIPLSEKTLEIIWNLPDRKLTLPWDNPSGDPITVRVCIKRLEGDGPFNPESIRRHWYAACSRAGISKDRSGFHHPRHTYASYLLASGLDIREISEYLGHSDPGFTLRTYCHLLPNAREAARKVIDEML